MEKTINIIEKFKSIQGEGIHSGLPTFFIRLAGCNLRCSYCDTKYAYGKGVITDIKILVEEAKIQGVKFICITGGEPLNQANTKTLMMALLKAGFQLDIETNGSMDIAKFPNSNHVLYSLDIKCPSSLMHKSMHFDNLKVLKQKDQVKFIMKSRLDYQFAKDVIKKYNLIGKTNIIFSPIGGVKADKLAQWVLEDNLQVRIGIQLHKIIWKSERKELILKSAKKK
ncbi:MAG: radical SAM protein [Patescibacteria group bacterium]|jgi:7-carboxy-7-deazaguanine synthase